MSCIRTYQFPKLFYIIKIFYQGNVTRCSYNVILTYIFFITYFAHRERFVHFYMPVFIILSKLPTDMRRDIIRNRMFNEYALMNGF